MLIYAFQHNEKLNVIILFQLVLKENGAWDVYMTVRVYMKASVTPCMATVPVMLGGLVHTVKGSARRDIMEW